MKGISLQYLDNLKPRYINNGYSIPKWIKFCEVLINEGWIVNVHRAKTTVSKYVYIQKEEKSYKVRFSNHKANFHKEKIQDCDYYVGIGNYGVITTEKLLETLTGKMFL